MLSVMDLNLHLNRNRHVFRFWKYVFAFENAIISVVQTGVRYASLSVIFNSMKSLGIKLINYFFLLLSTFLMLSFFNILFVSSMYL